MTKPREPKRPKTHTVVKRRGTVWTVEYFCTACGKAVKSTDVNKRCKGAG